MIAKAGIIVAGKLVQGRRAFPGAAWPIRERDVVSHRVSDVISLVCAVHPMCFRSSFWGQWQRICILDTWSNHKWNFSACSTDYRQHMRIISMCYVRVDSRSTKIDKMMYALLNDNKISSFYKSLTFLILTNFARHLFVANKLL